MWPVRLPSVVIICVCFGANHFSGSGSVDSGGASAVKEPGHFEVRKSSSQVTRMHFFLKKVDDFFFSCRPQNAGRQRSFAIKIRQVKRSDMVTFFIFFSRYYRSKAKRRARQGGARAVDLPATSFDLAHPGVAPPLSVEFTRFPCLSLSDFDLWPLDRENLIICPRNGAYLLVKFDREMWPIAREQTKTQISQNTIATNQTNTPADISRNFC